MIVGFSKLKYNVKEREEMVSICVNILSHREALRQFTVVLLPEEGKIVWCVCVCVCVCVFVCILTALLIIFRVRDFK